MDYIIKNGVGSKNTTPNTEKSISLALGNNELSGVSLNLNMTKDHKIVISSKNYLEENPSIKIENATLEELRVYNIGTRVSPERIMTLEEVLTSFKNDPKSFIFTMENHGKNNRVFVEEVAKIVNQYPNSNIYIKSPIAEIILYLRDLVQFAKVGAILLDESTYFLKQNLDFYSLSGPSLCPYWSKQKSEEGTLLMVENIVDESDAVDTIHEVKLFLNKMYMIVNDATTLNTIYPVCQKELENLERID